jgi:hypothetical protein
MSASEVTAVSPMELYRTVWTKVSERFFDTSRLEAWRAWEHKFDGQLMTEQQAVSAVSEMLESLGDAYTYLIAPANATNGVRPNVVSAQMLANGYAYVSISTFLCNDLTDQLQKALRSVRRARGFIVDVRDNGGGWINQGSNATSLFLDGGVNLILRSRTDKGLRVRTTTLLRKHFKVEEVDEAGNVTDTSSWDRWDNIVGDRPLVILVNGATASAAEMFAMILRDCRGAILIGTETFGKGIGQDEYEMPLGYSLKVTDVQWLSASKVWIGDCGQTYRNRIKPDYYVEPGPNPRYDRQLQAAVDYLSSVLGEQLPQRSSGSGLLIAAGALALVFLAGRSVRR